MTDNMIKKRTVCNYFFLLTVIIITGIIIYATSNIKLQILAFGTLALFGAIMVKFDIFHPYCWFSGMFLLYSLSYPILYCTGNLDPWLLEKAGIPNKLIFLEWVAFSIFLLVVSPKQVKFINKRNKKLLFTKANKLLYVVMYTVVLLAVVSISQGGFKQSI